VVIAIIGILAAIAVPRFAAIQTASKGKADAATAQQIITAARVYEADKNDAEGSSDLTKVATLMSVPAGSQSGSKAAFSLAYDSTTKKYTVSWATGGSYVEGGTYTPPTN